MTMRNKWIKTLAIFGLALSIALSGMAVVAPQQAEAASSSKADKIIDLGLKYLGTPYKFGAPAGSTKVFDCSSFVQYVYKRNGISLPRTSRSQAKVGHYVKRSELRKGDLVFFWTSRTGRGKIGHVAIYMGNGKILHTYRKGIGVTVSKLNSKYWSSHYVTARRVL